MLLCLGLDVKPENLLLTSSGRVMLSDFGIAKILPDIEKCQATSGTHGYMVTNRSTDLKFDMFNIGRDLRFTRMIILMARLSIGFVLESHCMSF